jgi:tRNA modification GTPase
MNPPTHQTGDTLVAVSSPPGRSHRGLIRLSGDDARFILGQLITEPIDQIPTRGLIPVHLTSPAMPALLCCFKAPHSYTGQDTAELQVPGHPALLDRLLHRAIDAGARLAEPGEFTFRAFLAGKLDLTQAEGIAATINATSDTQLRAARHLLNGELGGFARSLVDDLGTRLALVEAGIDFTDQEDVVPIGPGVLDGHLADLEARLTDLLTNSRSWSEVDGLPWVVLVGAPSAGKSTLFNALLGRERAVIDPLPGTTRDVLCEPMKITTSGGDEREWMLIDIAGLDEPAGGVISPLDDQARAAAHQAIERADLILRIVDSAAPPSAVDVRKHTAPTLTVLSKSDLTPNDQTAGHGADTILVSATTGQNIDGLRSAISERLGRLAVSVNAEMLTLQPRHEQALRSAREEVSQARTYLADQLSARAIDDVELIAGHLRQALNDLAALGGQLTPDDVIGRVFATFCVGK